MNQEQIIKLIERNKVTGLQLKDYSGNVLTKIEAKTTQAAIKELEEVLPDFVTYRKLEIKAKTGDKNTTWATGFTWFFEYDGAEAGKGKTIAGVPVPGQTIGVMDFIAMFTTMTEKNMDMTRENMKLQNEILKEEIKRKHTDPNTWAPLIREFGPALGLNIGSIQGPPGTARESTKELHFGDVDSSKMTEEQIQEAIQLRMISISKKIKGSQFLNLIISINENPNLTMQVDGLTTMLQAIAKNPSLFDMAKSYIK